MDVRKPPENGKTLGEGNSEGKEAPAQKKEILNRRQARWLAFGKEKKDKQFHLTKDIARTMTVNKLYAKTTRAE